ncbi:MAG: hypothetical protein ABIN91_04115 [Mucilaginibacter sp.]|uniref:hypothetical protein n=1 Tax=Mucilaginibacter sp. TaxID=1882438 RepID=UPI003264C904
MDTAISLSTRSLQFFVLGRRWQSDLEFFKLETNFLQRLIREYTLDLPDSALLKIAGRNLIKLKEDSRQTDVILDEQLKQLELMAEDIIPENTAEISVVQVQLEYLMVNLTKEYRAVKREIFKLIEGSSLKTT